MSNQTVKSSTALKLVGSLVAIITPMHEDGRIDYDSLRNLIEWHIESGTDGLIVAGTTGEAPTLSTDELFELVKFAVEVVSGRIPVVAGSGTNSTSSSIERSHLVTKAGADALLVVVPYYNKPTQAGIKAHFLAIADAVELPIILYNVPGRTSCDMLPDTVSELSVHPRIVALKEAKEYDGRIQEIIKECKGKLLLLSGDDLTCREFMLLGGDGIISVTANIAPKAMKQLCVAALAGDAELSEEIDSKICSLHSDLFKEPNPTPTKWALVQMGKIPSDGTRLPLLTLSPKGQAIISASLQKAGISQ